MLKDIRFTVDKIEVHVTEGTVEFYDGESSVPISRVTLGEINNILSEIDSITTRYSTLALPAPKGFETGKPSGPPSLPITETEKPLTAPPRYTPPAKPSSPISYGPDEPNRDHPLDKAIQPPEPTTEMLITLDGVLQSYVVIQMAHGFIGPNNSVVDIASAQLFPNSEDTRQRAVQLGGVTKSYPEVGRYRVMYIDMLTREPTWLLDAATGDTTPQRKDALTFIGREASFTFGQRHIPSAAHRMHVIPCTGAYA
jgi:hypothetical protein